MSSMSSMTKPRLTQATWIEAGLEALRAQGPEALKAEPLARRLKTTKGSFYWHFKDVSDYHAALLQVWEAGAEPALEGDTAVTQLRGLAATLAGGGGTEPAIRAWAKSHPGAAEAVARVDARRLTRLEELLGEVGIGNREMARILYGAALGMREMRGDADDGPEAVATLVDLVLALR